MVCSTWKHIQRRTRTKCYKEEKSCMKLLWSCFLQTQMFILECHSILICETGTFPSAQRHASGCHTGRELAQEPGANKGYFGSKRLFSPGSRRGKVSKRSGADHWNHARPIKQEFKTHLALNWFGTDGSLFFSVNVNNPVEQTLIENLCFLQTIYIYICVCPHCFQ